ncbi:vWA domain-containing protein [Chryseobacterium gwangjuense]|uniref:vWA domain-containing protein n=1 Tax=Chryseobacterium gwangjuense TaxID=1069980 RepID=UPI001E4FF3AB|nr:VWA domain-containing protein [Chryseobacterium gwangjuense]MCE3076266.1 von Willebrand factor type A domain-containing protein [Chryseobacterium gwangjuense]
MENNHDIDKKFNEASKVEEPATFPGFDKVWAQVEEKLDKKENRKRIIPIWFPYGIAASLIIGLGAFYFINKNDVLEIKKPAIAHNTASPKINSNIQIIDSTIQSNIKKEIDGNQLKGQNKQEIVTVSAPPSMGVMPGHKFQNYNQPIPYPALKVQSADTLKVEDINEVVVTGALGIKKKGDEVASSNVVAINNGVYTTDSYDFNQKNNYHVSPSEIKLKKNNSKNIVVKGPAQIYVTGNEKGYFESQPYNNIAAALAAKAPGLTINSIGYSNNNQYDIKIRGSRTLTGQTTPIIVINGVISDQKALSSIPPNKIESLTTLLGLQASALYGSQGSNGAIVVTTKKISRKEKKAFKKLQKVQDSIKKAKFIEKQNNEEYDAFVENPFELTKNQSVSTFSIDVDNAAYSNIRRMINNGEYVDKNAVRIEEMINYFKYDYPQPKNNQPFSINTEYNDSPWNSKHKLLKIGLQGKNIPANQLPASNFVFLIDVSGSMDAPNKLPLLKSSFKVLLDQLRPEDKVGIVVYAGSAGMVLPPTSAGEKNKIIGALDQLQAGGSTAGGEGIELAYKLAQENFIKGGNNRVIIATDGDFNVGASSTGDLQTLVEEKRKSGVFLTCLGFGMGNFKDNRMETLANKGNGNYAYIDTMQEANKFLGKEFAGSMYAIAKDVKIQIEFNPKYVKSYRLIGYENRKLKNEDFTNDKIDAGELGSGHTVTALYEVIPVDVNSDFLPKETELKYSVNTSSENFGDELATVKFRYKKPDGDKSSEIVQVIKNTNDSFSSSSDDFKFTSSVAWFGLVLRNSSLIKNKNVKEIENLAKKGKGKDDDGYRAEFVRLVESYKTQQK